MDSMPAELLPIGYDVGGRTFTGYLAEPPAAGTHPGVLVIHEGGGLTDETRRRAAMLAALGYTAFAMDLFGEPVTDLERGREIVRALRADAGLIRARTGAALERLAGRPNVDRDRLAAVGFCLGGAAAIELARTGAPLNAVVGFHAGILPGTAEEDAAIRARVLLCHGAADPVVPLAEIQAFAVALTAAGVDWQLHVHGGVGHSFTNPAIDSWNLPGFFYDERADRRSWAAMRALLEEALG